MREQWRAMKFKVLLLASGLAPCVLIHAAESGSAGPVSAPYRKAGEDYAALTASYREAGMCPGRSDSMVQKQRQLAESVAGIAAKDGARALLYAVAANSLTDVQRLLADGAPRVSDDGTLLHVAARYGDPPVMKALIETGLSIDALGASTGTSSGSALTVAVGDGRKENVEWLIGAGADVNAKNPRGASVLTYAIFLCKDQALVSTLVEAGAIPDNYARTLASQRGFDLHTKAALTTRNRLNPPIGWHGPTTDELNAEPLRKNSPTQYVEAKADFDGDGKEDHAALFTADDGKSEAVFVKLTSRNAGEWVAAASVEHPKPSMGVGMGISVAKPRTIKTACGKGYWNCKTGEPSELNLKTSGIIFFRFESADSILYWDKATKQFKQIWTSD
jgi:hypothetical protein